MNVKIFRIKLDISSKQGIDEVPIILLTPQGRPFSQSIALELSKFSHLILICGHYEGVDERVRMHMITDEISIGDYVLSGGELAAMVVVDAVLEVLKVSAECVQPPSPIVQGLAAEYITGIVSVDDRTLVMLAASRLLNSRESLTLSALTAELKHE